MIYTFGVHNIHQRTNITEGGVIGLMLLIEHWLQMSPAYITPILDLACYLLAFKFLGGNFIKVSIISTMFVSGFYKIWELFPPMLPDLSEYPLIAAVLGGIFVGVGVGLIVRQGGSSGGDDALALTISHVLHWRLSRAVFVYGYGGFSIIFNVYSCCADCFFTDYCESFFFIDWLDPGVSESGRDGDWEVLCYRSCWYWPCGETINGREWYCSIGKILENTRYMAGTFVPALCI